ncbi:MAG: succinylglutamate desuccinylase [Paraburkholderia sp.]|nr:succinylglutamate desuccinylase [Paraburkholderia sp.]
MLADFLGFSLAGARPDATQAKGECAAGLRYAWLGDGALLFEPSCTDEPGRADGTVVPMTAAVTMSPSVLLSAGVHGDETAPIELLSRLVADLASGALPLACRLLVVLGNLEAMRAGCRYVDDDLNRLFCGWHAQLPASREAPRAAALEAVAAQFFGQSQTEGAAWHTRWHIDMHTAIRASVFEQFALLPHTGDAPPKAMFDWLAQARMSAVLLHTAKGNTYTQYTAETFGARACTLELGKVRPFGQNDLVRFAAADQAVRALVCGARNGEGSEGNESPMSRVFTVVDQITKRSEAFELHLAVDTPNFTPFAKGTLLATDGECRYVVSREEERIVFPNPGVKPGLRAALMVIETKQVMTAAKSLRALGLDS